MRLVATLSMAVSAGGLVFLAQSDFHNPGFLVPFALAALGLSLSIGLTASSIAIMGSVDASKGGAAGSLEATGYELGTGLGITLFGVFTSSVFSRAIALPPGLPQDLSQQASKTIGDAYIVAKQLPEEQGAALIEAGKVAFSQAHAVILTTVGAVVAVLAVAVFFMLAGYRKSPRAGH